VIWRIAFYPKEFIFISNFMRMSTIKL